MLISGFESIQSDSMTSPDGDHSSLAELTRQCALQALALSVQDWNNLGEGEDSNVATPKEKEACVERITSLLVVRIVAVLSADSNEQHDLSTSGICRKALIDNRPWHPDKINGNVLQQLRRFVRFILENYRDVPFHNFQHAYHVVISANKIMDLMLTLDSDDFLDGKPPPAFGLRHDPVALMALLFAALIHDVDHKGISNRQLALEEHPLAVSYNDNSINEQRSLQLAFEELLRDKYVDLRSVMFPKDIDYRFFRSTVVNAVLSTDIASPERSQLNKSKWKEAFGMERGDDFEETSERVPRRGSMVSNISMPRVGGSGFRSSRRGSNASQNSMVSDVTFDSYTKMLRARHLTNSSQKQDDDSYANNRIRSGKPVYNMEDSITSFVDEDSANSSLKDSVMEAIVRKKQEALLAVTTKRYSRMTRRHSMQSYSTDSAASYGQGSIILAHKRQEGSALTRDKMNLEKFRKYGELPAKKMNGGTTKHGTSDVSSSSISLTPPSSDDERDYLFRNLISAKSDLRFNAGRPPSGQIKRMVPRRASTGNVTRFRPLTGQRIDEEEVTDTPYQKLFNENSEKIKTKMLRRASSGAYSEKSASFRKRLGILRGMDFSGESIEVHPRGSIGGTSLVSGVHDEEIFLDEPDELKALVVLELILRAADVAHSLQSWTNMKRWSSRLYRELSMAHRAGRGPDPGPGWFDNQAKALESYVGPLALQLDETGVFGEFLGAVFYQQLEANRDQWLVDGFEVTESLRAKTQKMAKPCQANKETTTETEKSTAVPKPGKYFL